MGCSSGVIKAKEVAEGKRSRVESKKKSPKTGGRKGSVKKTTGVSKMCVTSKELKVLLEGSENDFDQRQGKADIQKISIVAYRVKSRLRSSVIRKIEKVARGSIKSRLLLLRIGSSQGLEAV